jgi:iron complex outermembrane receptor protein
MAVASLLSALCATAPAQDTVPGGEEAGRSLELGTVVVSARRNPIDLLPTSTVIVDGSDILAKSPLLQGVDILRDVPGLQVSTLSQGAFRERFLLRGFASAGEAVASFLDGVPLNESNGHGDGTIDLSTMIPEEIDRVEVIKGPFSALYGNFARAGSISFITKNRVDENLASLSLGSWNTQRAGLTLGRAGEKVSQYYAVDTYHTDGFRDKSETRRSNIAARWSFELSPRSTLRIGGRGYSADWDAPGYLTQAEWDAGGWQGSNTSLDAGEKERYDINVNYNLRISDTDSLGLTAFRYGTDFHRWRDNGNPQTEEHNVLAGTMLKGLYSKTGSFLTRKDSLLFGVDLLREDGERRTWNNTTPWARSLLTADGEYYQNTYSAYGQLELQPLEHLGVVAGIRYDYFDLSLDRKQVVANRPTGVVDAFRNSMSAVSPKLGATFDLSSSLALYGNVGKGFYLPTSFDKFINAQLGPVDLLSYEMGLRFRVLPMLRGSVALFRIDAQDDVTRQGGPTGPLVNSGDIRRQGVDAELTLELAEGLSWIASASYIDAQFRDYATAGSNLSGNVPIETPPYFYSTSLEYFNDAKSIGARLAWHGKGEVRLDNDNTFRYGAYSYGDAQVYYETGPYTIDLKIGNITDVRYAEYAFSGTAAGSQRYGPARPRNATLSIRMEF